ncbi:MAG: PhoH family protein [Calditrichales bacterium]|nr:MAG: PhoH family protein [Calditrichales bacterium]
MKNTDPLVFYGVNDRNLKIIESNFEVFLVGRGENISVSGAEGDVDSVLELFSELVFIINKNKSLTRSDLLTAIQIIKSETVGSATPLKAKEELNSVVLFTESNYVKPSTPGQKTYMDAARENEILFCIGPAGTGKTYLSVALAIDYLNKKAVKKIVLARPAVEAGESLGYLPGDYREKIDPYLRPLYDALTDMIPRQKLKKLMDEEIIEVIPLAFMRGRTLNNAFVILDEAQNCTFLQMKMFLTRIGFNSRSIINGDVTQIDLPDKSNSGLVDIQSILDGIDGIRFIHLDSEDVVRHQLVKKIIDAYEKRNEKP